MRRFIEQHYDMQYKNLMIKKENIILKGNFDTNK